jgi:hypothetical protein
VVARDQQRLYEYLSQVSAKSDGLLVILDRRQGERRHQATPETPERRRADRRAGTTRSEELAKQGFVIIGEQRDVSPPTPPEA